MFNFFEGRYSFEWIIWEHQKCNFHFLFSNVFLRIKSLKNWIWNCNVIQANWYSEHSECSRTFARSSEDMLNRHWKYYGWTFRLTSLIRSAFALQRLFLLWISKRYVINFKCICHFSFQRSASDAKTFSKTI